MLAATEPVPPAVLAQLVELPTDAGRGDLRRARSRVRARRARLHARRVAGGYRFQTHPDAHPYVERFVLDGQTARLSGPRSRRSRSSPTSSRSRRAQISAIRGVNVEATLEDARRARLRRGDRARPDAGQPVAVRHHRRCSSSGSGSTRSTSCPRSATSSPTRRSSRRSNAGLHVPGAATTIPNRPSSRPSCSPASATTSRPVVQDESGERLAEGPRARRLRIAARRARS